MPVKQRSAQEKKNPMRRRRMCSRLMRPPVKQEIAGKKETTMRRRRILMCSMRLLADIDNAQKSTPPTSLRRCPAAPPFLRVGRSCEKHPPLPTK